MKRTVAQRLAPNIRLTSALPWSAAILQSLIDANDTGAYRAPCWLWAGRMSRHTIKFKRLTRLTERGPRIDMAAQKPEPIIEIAGKRQHPARVLYEAVTAVTVDPSLQVRSTCHTPKCVNPAHRSPVTAHSLQTHPEPPSVRDDIDDLVETMANHAKRYSSFDELREAVAPEFTVAEWEEAFKRNPSLKKELIRC